MIDETTEVYKEDIEIKGDGKFGYKTDKEVIQDKQLLMPDNLKTGLQQLAGGQTGWLG